MKSRPGVVGEGQQVSRATRNGAFELSDVGRGIVGNPWTMDDLGYDERGVLTVKGKVSIL